MLPLINIPDGNFVCSAKRSWIFFLALAVKLPELLAYVNMEEETLNGLQQKLIDFLK